MMGYWNQGILQGREQEQVLGACSSISFAWYFLPHVFLGLFHLLITTDKEKFFSSSGEEEFGGGPNVQEK